MYISTLLLFKARVIRTLISTVMSSLLYQLSYNPYIAIYIIYTIYNTYYILYSTDKGFAPLFIGHEPIMLLLHQSALTLYILYWATKGFEPSNVMMKTLCLRPLDYEALYVNNKPGASIALASSGYKTGTLLLC